MKYHIFLALYCFAVTFAVPIQEDIQGKALKAKPSGGFKAGDFKKSSSTYRNAAGKNPSMYTASGAGTSVQKVPAPGGPVKGKDADHILEAQTVSTALNRGGLSKGAMGSTYDKVKDIVNSPSNLVQVDPKINQSKGQVTRSALGGGSPSVDPAVKDYTKKVNPTAMKTAKDIDKALKAGGITGVSVAKTHKDAMKKAGI